MTPTNVLAGNGLLLNVATPQIMGVININEDSFYDGSRVNSDASLLKKAEEMVAEGADMIDLGAMSSRPGAKLSDPETESLVISNAVRQIRKIFPKVFISIDTVWAKVAKAAICEGANMINDISACSIDPDLAVVISHHQVPYVLMHMKGQPENMQKYADYEDVMLELIVFFKNKIHFLENKGIQQIILDPGIGFSKTTKNNFNIIRDSEILKIFNKHLLFGISRKSFIYKNLAVSQEDALNGTSVLHGLLLAKGVNMLRVHDVKEAVQARSLVELLKKG